MPLGFIRATEFDAFKQAINGALEDAHKGWQQRYLAVDHDTRHDGSPLAVALSEIYFGHPIMHTLSGWTQKVNKHAAAHGDPLVKEALALLREFAPWAQIYTELKGKIAKRGDARLQPAEPRPSNPNQIRATCSCCFRSVAVASGGRRMAHHGYQRPELGWQTASCMGVAYPPFESSPDGTRAYRQAILNHASAMRKQAAEIREARGAIRVQRYGYGGRPMPDQVVEPSDPQYESAKRNSIARLQGVAETNERAAQELERRISTWQHVAVAGLTRA